MYTQPGICAKAQERYRLAKTFLGLPVDRSQIKEFCVHFLRDKANEFNQILKGIHKPNSIKMISKIFSISQIVQFT